MRPRGNLAGVEFANPPYNGNYEVVQTWQNIITESGYFFSKDAMRFFGSRIAWDTLTKINADTYGFITSEKHNAEPRLYSVRGWTEESGVFDLSDFQEFATLAEAKRYLWTDGFRAHLEKQLAKA
jgi:hypothetical protein